MVVLPVAAAPEFSVPLGHDSSKLQLLLCCSRPATWAAAVVYLQCLSNVHSLSFSFHSSFVFLVPTERFQPPAGQQPQSWFTTNRPPHTSNFPFIPWAAAFNPFPTISITQTQVSFSSSLHVKELCPANVSFLL